MDEKVPGLKFQKGSAPGKYTTSKFSKFSKFQGVHSLIFMFVYFFTLCCIVDVHTKRCDSIANWSLMAIKKLFNAPNYYNYNTVKDKPELFTILIQSLYYFITLLLCKSIYEFIYWIAPIIYFYLFTVFIAFWNLYQVKRKLNNKSHVIKW